MKIPFHLKQIVTPLICATALSVSLNSKAQTDTFNDGDDTTNPEWTHYDPLSGVGGNPATFSFPGGNTYRIQAPTSPDPGTLGPARVASTLPTVYTDFYASVDLVDWDDTLDQAVGLLARLDSIGLGTTIGYAFTYQEIDHNVSISRNYR